MKLRYTNVLKRIFEAAVFKHVREFESEASWNKPAMTLPQPVLDFEKRESLVKFILTTTSSPPPLYVGVVGLVFVNYNCLSSRCILRLCGM